MKIKSFGTAVDWRSVYVVFIVILVGLGGFGLGRLSKSARPEGKIGIVYNEKVAAANVATIPAKEAGHSSLYVASRRGKKYYGADCPAGQKLKEENKIYFQSATEAEAAGYTASESC